MKFKIFKKLLVMCFATCFTVGSAFAAVDEIELDGNVKNNTNIDWEEVVVNGGGALAVSVDRATGLPGVIADLPPKSIFWKGGSKDIHNTTDWWWKDGSVPDKDDIRNGIAAAYRDSDDDLIFYFGADRYSNNGDAIFGFWFFQEDVGPLDNGRFSGSHKEGDLFIVMEYPQGSNAEPFVQVMKWVDANGDVSENLELLFDSDASVDNAKCDDPNVAKEACAITNEDDAQLTDWAYMAKDGSTATYPHESFFEGRVNVSELLGDNIPCFSSFLIETRSSRSETAQLKDFIGGEFPLCSIFIEKICKVERLTTSNDDTTKDYLASFLATITNDGAGAYDKDMDIVIVDDAGTKDDGNAGNGDETLDDVIYESTVGGLTNETDVPAEGYFEWGGTFFTDDNPPTNTVTVTIDFGNSTATSTHELRCQDKKFNPNIDLSKKCDSELILESGLVALNVNYTIDSCNLGDVPLVATISDPTAFLGNKVFTLDVATKCEVDAECDGTYCTLGVGIGGSGLCLADPGIIYEDTSKPVCAQIEDSYLSKTVPTSHYLESTNKVTVTAVTIFDEELDPPSESVTAHCDLCPIVPEPIQDE